jgi:MFS family permease
MALVGSAHFISHFFQLSLPPLFPLLHDYFNVSYVELGSVLTVFYLVSGICQAFAGILVDKYGARPVLMTGILLMATSIGIAGFVPQFWMFYPLMACAAVGNSVFHPADLAALSHQVSKKRLGRAFSIHAAAGRFGFAAGPLVVGTIAAMGHWRIALITAGLLGWGVALLFFRFSHHFVPDHGDAHHNKPHVKISYRQLITTPAILFAMGYFIFTVAAGSGFQAFSSVSFVNFFHMPLQTAATALSVYFVSSAVGMLLGGVIADHTPRHVLVAVLGLFGCCVFVGLLAVNILPFALIMVVICLIGLCDGVTAPSRDILIKGAAPPGATGRVFGLVYSGVDAGGTIGPLLFGILADAQAYQALFLTIALLYACGIPFVIPIGQRQVTKTA